MIRYVDEEYKDELARLVSGDDIFACRIACLLDSYGTGYPFLCFYVQTDDDGRAVSAVSEYYSDMTVMLTEHSDTAELSEFLPMRGFSSVLAERPLLTQLPCEEGVIMRLADRERLFSLSPCGAADIETQPDLRELWRLLKSCEDESFRVPAYEEFLPDISHKLRHGTALCAAAVLDGRPVGAAMTVAQSSRCAVIGAVCVKKEYRRRGLGSLCIRELCSRLGGREIYIMRDRNKNEDFYRSLGFENAGGFYPYSARRLRPLQVGDELPSARKG